ncbi:helix-turn-helix transcriptional regulator [Mucilaginibacter sp. JRF]|uniref:helix-turn-helix domain-containing protein n=1 Tax=Mucilaginibacter sp. JRF TaxID=2780088 RepID=UPI001880AA81|nr:helix-turn-helix transcriptional regulator [Mucilaginibacter sp. JRF]MBE9583474.1 helix-turn-helix transcriptional regulator [Mucilaginibacter sp. JRF]
MKSEAPKITKIESITEIHRMLGIPSPLHPFISLLESIQLMNLCQLPVSYAIGFYKITFVTKLGGKFKYGQGYYDFDEGSLMFTAPGQVVGHIDGYQDNEGLSLFIHPDFFQGYPLAAKIKQFGFFSYASNEALHISEQERATMLSIYNIIREELNSRIDDFSHEVIIAQIELLLSYAKRFYKRQFLTRQVVHNDLLQQLENLLDAYFKQNKPISNGIPTVQYLAEQLNYTPNYLSDMLRSLTGLNAQQHIHQRLIERSKELLSTTSLSISEVAYELGFEHSQSFSRLFKIKTKVSPAQFRATFNWSLN